MTPTTSPSQTSKLFTQNQILVAFLLHIKSALIFRFHKKQHFEYVYHTISLTKQLTSWLPPKKRVRICFYCHSPLVNSHLLSVQLVVKFHTHASREREKTDSNLTRRLYQRTNRLIEYALPEQTAGTRLSNIECK